jgi:hypothetical protein
MEDRQPSPGKRDYSGGHYSGGHSASNRVSDRRGGATGAGSETAERH